MKLNIKSKLLVLLTFSSLGLTSSAFAEAAYFLKGTLSPSALSSEDINSLSDLEKAKPVNISYNLGSSRPSLPDIYSRCTSSGLDTVLSYDITEFTPMENMAKNHRLFAPCSSCNRE